MVIKSKVNGKTNKQTTNHQIVRKKEEKYISSFHQMISNVAVSVAHVPAAIALRRRDEHCAQHQQRHQQRKRDRLEDNRKDYSLFWGVK